MNIDERDSVATQFGVSTEQVERDHLISYVLAFLSSSVGDQVQFIGGTALARTHLPAGRLSEDIDLIAIGDRKSVAATLDSDLPRALSRSHGRLTLDPMLGSVASTQPATLRSPGGLSVRIQLLSAHDRVVWPSERRVMVQRYTDAPAAELLVPTPPAFAASKTSTWAARRSRPLGPVGAQSPRRNQRRCLRPLPTPRTYESAACVLAFRRGASRH